MIRIYFGKSGAGKDFYKKKAVEEEGLLPIIAFTSRPMREGEVDGEDYNFTNKFGFNSLIENHQLVEWREYKTKKNGVPDVWYYGTPVVDPNRDWVAVMTISGIKDYIKHYGPDKINPIYVYADYEVREKAAMERGGFDCIEWERRAKADDEDFSDYEIHSLEDLLGRQIEVIVNNR